MIAVKDKVFVLYAVQLNSREALSLAYGLFNALKPSCQPDHFLQRSPFFATDYILNTIYHNNNNMISHTPKEMVNIEMMMQSLEGYFSIISELLELEPEQFPNAN